MFEASLPHHQALNSQIRTRKPDFLQSQRKLIKH